MTTRNHNNRSEKQKGHTPDKEAVATSHNHKGASRDNKGGGDEAGGGPGHQGQGQANNPTKGQQRGHG